VVVEFINKETDPEAPRRIDSVRFLSNARAFIVRMDSGRSFALSLRELAGADDSNVVRCTVARDRSYFRVRQASGNVFEVPWDLVLHHCDPTYEHYKDRPTELDDESRALRIGNRVRALRTERGWSVAYLAERSGMMRPNFSRLETGRHVPSLETLERVADALEAPIADLVAR
jgi:DNA-binding XRE family transcriptional regulator